MIPLTESLKMAFCAVVQNRPPTQRPHVLLTFDEIVYITDFLARNCAFIVSNDEIRVLFRSFQLKRTAKRKKSAVRQLSLYV